MPSYVFRADGFASAETNPTLTNALESSLWELYSHREHYHAAVSTLAKIFQEAFTRPSYGMEDFLDHTYGTVRLLASCRDCMLLVRRSCPSRVLRRASHGSGGRADRMQINVLMLICVPMLTLNCLFLRPSSSPGPRWTDVGHGGEAQNPQGAGDCPRADRRSGRGRLGGAVGDWLT